MNILRNLNLLIGPCIFFFSIGCQEEELPQTSSNNTNSGNDTSELFQQGSGVSDVDGNFYTSIIINSQEWMQQNLAVSRFRNGDSISNDLDDSSWFNTSTGAYTIYNSLTANNELYGKLYNWYAVNDGRGLCPTGWHIPSDAEWSVLESSLGGLTAAGGKMKTVEGWNSPNLGATNESGFTALPGGFRSLYGFFANFESTGFWWTSTEFFSVAGWSRSLESISPSVIRTQNEFNDGISVRCVRD
jgi:uncharacterized protein (TIGR02145 family)